MRDAARPADIVRQVAVIAAVSFMVVAAMVGTGLLGGTNVRDLQDGALDADATVLAPGRPAFSIWSVIYVLTIAYAVWQALPGQRTRERQRAAGGWIALTAVLNGGWLLAAQFTELWVTVVAIVVLLAALGRTLSLLVRRGPRGRADRVLMDAGVGLHLGWVALATVADVTAWLTRAAPRSWGERADLWGVLVLVVVAAIGVAVAVGTRGRVTPGLAMVWGLVWIAVARATGEPHSPVVAVAAGAAAVVVVVAVVVRAVWTGPRAPVRTRGRTRAAAAPAR